MTEQDLIELYYAVIRFMETGGDVLYMIMGVTVFLWALIVERYWFMFLTWPRLRRKAIDRWEAREDHQSWYAHKIREMIIGELNIEINSGISLIKTVVALCPMFGLLGTVTGMISVFDTLASIGSSNARAMASGVSMATIPTMAGMVAALSGLYFSVRLQKGAQIRLHKIADRLEIKHELARHPIKEVSS